MHAATMQPGDQPVFTFDRGVVYVTGWKRRIPWRGADSSVDLATYLHSVGRVISKTIGVDQFDIEAPNDPTRPGEIVITIRHEPKPYGQRHRGARGGKKHAPHLHEIQPA